MEAIQIWELTMTLLTTGTVLACIAGFLYVDGDLGVEVSGLNNDSQAATMFRDLLEKTKSTIDIHDDGNDSPHSMYNNEEVIETMRQCLDRGVTIRCLFNDREPIRLRELGKSGEYGDHFQIWHLEGVREDPDTHYQIVDDGCFVHISNQEHGADVREYHLRTAVGWWKFGTRKRIRQRFSDHFEKGLKISKREM